MALSPKVLPFYAKKARIERPNVIKALPLTVGEISSYARVHANTVSNKMAGNTGLYLQVHNVFTGISIASDNAFPRDEFVHFLDEETNQFKHDPALAECRVFPTLAVILRELGDTEKGLASSVGVQMHIVRNVLNGLPVASNVVDELFAHVARKKSGLSERECIFR